MIDETRHAQNSRARASAERFEIIVALIATVGALVVAALVWGIIP